MKKTFKELFKGIVTSSIAAIAGTHGANAAPVVSFSDDQEDALKEEIGSVKTDLSNKLLLNITSDDDYYLTGHRSHSSHRSHRSHSSHRSGSSHYSSSHSSHYSSTSTSKSKSTSKSSSSTSSSTSTSTSGSTSTSTSNRLSSSPINTSNQVYGSRVLKKGMSGSDVTKTSDYLVKLGYLQFAMLKKDTRGNVVYDDNMVKAVQAYQKDKELLEDGELAKGTATYLAFDAMEYRALGSRDLTVGMSGTDVTAMKNLLIDKGYSDAKKVSKYEVTLFDTSLLDVLKLFLNDIGLDWEGKVDSQMVKFLKKKYDD